MSYQLDVRTGLRQYVADVADVADVPVSLVKHSPVPARTEPQGTIWVCSDCMLTHANGETESESPDCEPWALWADEPAGSVTMGAMSADHYYECASLSDDECDCDCEHQPFSWSTCDGCGSRLGGDRWAFTYWG